MMCPNSVVWAVGRVVQLVRRLVVENDPLPVIHRPAGALFGELQLAALLFRGQLRLQPRLQRLQAKTVPQIPVYV